jgi:hypothetical protein
VNGAEPQEHEAVVWWCIGLALALHAWLAFQSPPIRGGADLVPHLQLIQQMGEAPGLRSTYAPAYHVLGAVLAPVVGLGAYPKLFALLSAIALLAGFRFLQRAAGLPGACTAVFALFPYGLASSWCLPKIEAAGYALAFTGMALLLRERRLGAGLLLTATFAVHTASAIFFGIAAGVLALVQRDGRGLFALAAGTLGASPLLAAHVLAGCTVAEALLLSRHDYLRLQADWSSLGQLDLIAVLANPAILALAVLGAPLLWRHSRPLAVSMGVLVFLYLNELWLAPFGAGTTLNLLRGLTTLALPASVAAGLALAGRPRWRNLVLAGCALWLVGAAFLSLPRACFVRGIELAELRGVEVERCQFRWRGPVRRP